MKIYTKNGDGGYSSVGGSTQKILKNDARMVFLGEVDELNASIGYLKCLLLDHDETTPSSLRRIQNVLFDVAAAVAYPSKVGDEKVLGFVDGETEWLESEIDRMTSELPPLTAFILPGNSSVCASYAHVVRTVCRRAERSVVSLGDSPKPLTRYVNRLSDYLFTLARHLSNDLEEDRYRHWVKR